MSDRGTFWPAPPDWAQAQITAPGLTITAEQGGRGVWLLSGDTSAIQARIAALRGVEATLPIAPDRVLLLTGACLHLVEGWDPAGLAISDLSQAHIRITMQGPGTAALLAQGSASLALTPNPRAASLAFAGLTVLYQPLTDGARLHVDHSQAPFLWHWLSAALLQSKDNP